jgi:hypothetical protein
MQGISTKIPTRGVKKMIFFLLFVGASAEFDQATFNNSTQKWMTLVEEILTIVSIGPLKDELTPSYLAKRSMEATIQAQTARFRSRVARSLIESIGTRATSCIDPSMTSDDAVQLVHDELVKHEFTVTWVKSSPLCPMVGGRGASALIVEVPAPVVATVEKSKDL